MLRTLGLDYPAIIVKNMQESLAFYERLGLAPLYTEPNRDDPESIIAMLAGGDGETFLQLVGPVNASVNIAQASPGIGSMQYLSLRISLAQIGELFHEMSSAGVQGSEEIVRGFERLVFLQDPNGVLITLTAWSTEPPPGIPRALVLQRAARLRERDGSTYVEDVHIRGAIAELQAAFPGTR